MNFNLASLFRRVNETGCVRNVACHIIPVSDKHQTQIIIKKLCLKNAMETCKHDIYMISDIVNQS